MGGVGSRVNVSSWIKNFAVQVNSSWHDLRFGKSVCAVLTASTHTITHTLVKCILRKREQKEQLEQQQQQQHTTTYLIQKHIAKTNTNNEH